MVYTKTIYAALITFILVGLTISCSPGRKNACLVYCENEARCGLITDKEMTACQKVCQTHLKISSKNCTGAFKHYVACNSQSASCSAEECYLDFEKFANLCPWYTNEIALTALIRDGKKIDEK